MQRGRKSILLFALPRVLPPTDIGPIYCVPIITADREGEPFGVAAFHNRKGSDKRIDEADRLKMRIAVKTLEAMLLSSQSKLVDYKQVFIVHGRNQQVRKDLEELLTRKGIRSVVIQSKARTGEDLLKMIEDQSQSCIAGFILLTPDDEGRLYAYGQSLRQRARQNVIFEAGLLTALFRRTGRICFLRQGELEIPSDLNGLLMETYGERIDEGRILSALRRWGFHLRSEAGQAGSHAAPAPLVPSQGPMANGTARPGGTPAPPSGFATDPA